MMFPEFLYYLGYSVKKRHSLKHQKRLPHKTISIGNITVGGTGKTPAAIAVAEEAVKRGLSPIILTRGYRGKAKGPCFISARKHGSAEGWKSGTSDLPPYCFSVEDAGDEPVLMAERLKDVPIVKCPDRYTGGMFALEYLKGDSPDSTTSSVNPGQSPHRFTHSPIIFILDDGFQHWKLDRDTDIVLINGKNPFGNRRMLPLGPLREPLTGLNRAGMFVITNGKEDISAEARKRGSAEGGKDQSVTSRLPGSHTSALVRELTKYNPAAPVFFAEHKLTGLRDITGNRIPMDSLKGKRCYAFCGLANPESFRQTVLSMNVDLCGFKAFRDHFKYTDGDILNLERQAAGLNCDILITTEKDMVKLRELKVPENLLCVEISFHADAAFFDSLFPGTSEAKS